MEAPASLSQGRPNPPGRARPLVLLVEDQQALRQLYARELTLAGFDVIEAGNGLAGVDASTRHIPDLVLMDLSLPVLDGWEATRRIKTDARTAHIPVMALTGHDTAGELERATRAGCNWFIPKPCPPGALVAEVRRLLATQS